MTSAPAIEVRSLAKTFGTGRGQITALHDVTFDVPPGSALAIVGENGSGKSTLLDILLGLTPPTSGSVRTAGETAALLELGAGFFHELTGRENAMQLALLSGVSKAEARALAQRAADFAEIGDFFDRPVRTYSAGMLMRLGFSIASNLKAPVVIIDEVLAVGDGYFQRKCIDRLVEMRRDHTTLVIAAHDLHALRGLCDQALWLQGGRVAALGPVDVVLSNYEDHLRKRSAARGEVPVTGGTGEVVIRQVRLTDARGVPRTEFRNGETLRVEVEFETREPLDSPVMGVALFRDDGVYCYGPNTLFDRQFAGWYEGRYVLMATFDDLPLLGGRYQASVAFYDKQHVYAYAWHHRLYPFTVTTERPDHGLVWLPHRFDVRRIDEGR